MKTFKLIFMTWVLASLVATALTVRAQVRESKFVIQGTLRSGTPMPSKLYLFRDQKLTDSSLVQNGTYRFSGNIIEVEQAMIKATRSFGLDANHGVLFLLNTSKLEIVSDPTLRNVILSGTGAQAANDYRTAISSTLLLRDSLSTVMAGKSYTDNAMLQANVRIGIAFMNEPMIRQMVSYVNKYPHSPASAYMVNIALQQSFLSSALKDSLLKSLYANQQIWVREKIAALAQKKKAEALAKQRLEEEQIRKNKELENETTPGHLAKDFRLNDPMGKEVSLSSFRGKYVLIDFWASWCGPCRAENPNLAKAFESYKDRGFTILGVSLDGARFGSKQSWVNAIKKDGLDWFQVIDLTNGRNEVAELYHVEAIPRNFLVDPSGIIIARDLRGSELEKKLASIFN